MLSSGWEVWWEESRRLELWGHTLCSTGGEFHVLSNWGWFDWLPLTHRRSISAPFHTLTFYLPIVKHRKQAYLLTRTPRYLLLLEAFIFHYNWQHFSYQLPVFLSQRRTVSIPVGQPLEGPICWSHFRLHIVKDWEPPKIPKPFFFFLDFFKFFRFTGGE